MKKFKLSELAVASFITSADSAQIKSGIGTTQSQPCIITQDPYGAGTVACCNPGQGIT